MAEINYSNFTLGIEEEYMVIDPNSRELKSHEQRIVSEGQKMIKDKVKAEMHQAVVEVGTDICRDVHEARKDISTLRKTISQIAGDIGLRVGASGTHPFSHWESQLITDHARYNEIVNELQEAARSNLIFGLHVHVGMESRQMANHIANSTRYFLPHIYALSTNSPFWEGRQTGYKSYRTKVFDKFPRTGIPEFFESIEAYDSFIKLLVGHVFDGSELSYVIDELLCALTGAFDNLLVGAADVRGNRRLHFIYSGWSPSTLRQRRSRRGEREISIDYRSLNWFVGLNMDDPIWDVTGSPRTASACSMGTLLSPSSKLCSSKDASGICSRTSTSQGMERCWKPGRV